MRFLIGLICGAAVILLLTQAAGTTQDGWLQRIPAIFDELAVRVGEVLELPPRGPSAAAGEPVVLPPPLPQQPDPVWPIADDAVPPPAATPSPVLPPDMTPAAELPPAARELARAVDAGAVPEPAARPIPRPPDPVPVDADVNPDADMAANPDRAANSEADVENTQTLAAETLSSGAAAASEQPVWVPFHSEMSASGFAGRLSASLDHPFRVERRGPGRYQVVFAYRDEQQRRDLLSEAAAVTGLPL